MLEFVGQALHDLSAIGATVLAGGTAAVAASAMVSEIAYGLRAKRRARYRVQEAMQEAHFRNLVYRAYASGMHMDTVETEELRRSVEEHLEIMSKADRQLVTKGLHQVSRAGSERYLRDLIDISDVRKVA